MDATPHTWKIFDAATPVLIHEYSFGPGTANALAVGAEDGAEGTSSGALYRVTCRVTLCVPSPCPREEFGRSTAFR
jgi:hypothetical protein